MPGNAHVSSCHNVESVQSEVELGFGFVVAMVTTSFKFLYFTLCLRWGLGCWRFFSAFLFYVLFSALPVQLCLRGGGLSSYSFPSPSINCCCSLVPASLVMGAGGIFCFPDPAFCFRRPSVAGPWEWGFLSISVPSPHIYLLHLVPVSRPFPSFTVLVRILCSGPFLDLPLRV